MVPRLVDAIIEELAAIDPYGLRPGTARGAPGNEYDLEARDLAEHLMSFGGITDGAVDAVWSDWFHEPLAPRIGERAMSQFVQFLNRLVAPFPRLEG